MKKNNQPKKDIYELLDDKNEFKKLKQRLYIFGRFSNKAFSLENNKNKNDE